MNEPEKNCSRFLRGIREDWSRKRSYGSNTAMMTVFQRQGLLRSSKSPLVFDKQDAWFVDSAACCFHNFSYETSPLEFLSGIVNSFSLVHSSMLNSVKLCRSCEVSAPNPGIPYQASSPQLHIWLKFVAFGD